MSIIFEIYNLRYLEKTSYQHIDSLSRNMAHQLDEIVRPMIFITEFLLSDSKTLFSISTLARIERTEQNTEAFVQEKLNLSISLSTYCNNVNFHRVLFFSEAGDILSSNYRVYTIPDGSADIWQYPNISLINAALGKPVLLPPFSDPWNPRRPQRVFSIIRLVMGNNINSYIEVQKPYTVLENIYQLHDDALRVAVINNRGEIFYSQLEDDENTALTKLLAEGKEKPDLGRIGGTISASSYSVYTNTWTIVMLGNEGIKRAIRDITLLTTVMALLMGIASLVSIWALSNRVTAPIRQFIANMEHTTLDNIAEFTPVNNPPDEFTKLYQSYNQFLKRLNLAIQQEKQMNLLHLQTQFDALQAQVNPHFLYNVLNVVSHRGVISGDETICEICEKLAGMLRYAAGTSRRLVTIREEIEYLKDYLYLLKTRYRAKFEYTIDIADEVMEQMIPKIVVQQLVENSINHGYPDAPAVMRISVLGWIDGGRWYIEVKDNGRGFTNEKKERIEREIRETRECIDGGNVRLDIGGMGLVNIYTRFLISFGESAILIPGNYAAGKAAGATVTIGAPLSPVTRLRETEPKMGGGGGVFTG
ncbi:MAG: histidine kinase [Treponema sp.]|nr:histidine kinase [Treponema sp.]